MDSAPLCTSNRPSQSAEHSATVAGFPAKLLAWLIRQYVRLTPPHRGRGWLARLAWRLNPQEFWHRLVEDLQVSICIADGADLDLWLGQCDLDDALVFSRQLAPGQVMLDVGAHLGLYTLLAARQVGPTGHVLAVEPVPRFAEKIRRHAEMNRLENITVAEMALAHTEGTGQIYDYGCESGLAGKNDMPPTAVYTVPVRTLDSLRDEFSLTRVDAIKIDVEGAEWAVCQGAARTLREDRPLLLIEFNRQALQKTGMAATELFEKICALGYHAQLVRGGKLFDVDRYLTPREAAALNRDPRKERYDYDNYLFRA